MIRFGCNNVIQLVYIAEHQVASHDRKVYRAYVWDVLFLEGSHFVKFHDPLLKIRAAYFRFLLKKGD